MKFWLRACPKCGGDLKLEVEITGAYVQCIQCGLELDPGQQRRPGKPGRRFHFRGRYLVTRLGIEPRTY